MNNVNFYEPFAIEPSIWASNRPSTAQSQRFQALINQNLPSKEIVATSQGAYTPASFFVVTEAPDVPKKSADSEAQKNKKSMMDYSMEEMKEMGDMIEQLSILERLPQTFEADRPGLAAPTIVPLEIGASPLSPNSIRLGPLDGVA